MDTFYSQYEQDKFIYDSLFKIESSGRFSNRHNSGFFVDIGAYDGKALSNTLHFENLGWKGLCFEPIPDVFKKLVENRPGAECHQCVIGHQERESTTFLQVTGPAEMLSGVLDYYDSAHMFRINKETFESGGEQNGIDVEMHTLDHFLLPGTEIDYLSLDTEGGEPIILENILKNFTPKVISVEANYQAEAQRILEFTKEKYDLVKQLGCDMILVIKQQ